MSTETVAWRLGAGLYAKPLEDACIQFGIVSELAKAHFLSQVAVESAGFSRTRENLNYSVDGLLKTFGRHRITEKQCRMYGRRHGQKANQEAIANCVYGGAWGRENLGNTEPGDGARFVGRGLKQLTGRSNYTAYSTGMYGDDRVVLDPLMLERMPDAALSAGWFWQAKGCNAFAERDDLVGLTRRINGGLNGLADRARWLERAKSEFSKLTVQTDPEAQDV